MNTEIISARSFLDISKMYNLRSFLRLEVCTVCFLYLMLSSGWAYRDTKHMDERVPKQTGGIEELGFSPFYYWHLYISERY